MKFTCCGGREYTLWAPLEDKLVATLYETNININEDSLRQLTGKQISPLFLAFSSKPKTVMIFQLLLDGTPFMVQN